MPELRNNCFMYDELLLDIIKFVVGMIFVCYCKGQPWPFFSVSYAYAFPLLCKTLLFLGQIVQVLCEGCKKNNMV